jgi:hypothetical protein
MTLNSLSFCATSPTMDRGAACSVSRCIDSRSAGPRRRPKFIDYLNSHGVPTFNRSAAVGDGYKICAQIHEGMSPDDAINQYMGFGRLWSPATVYAAQHELCPNTLPPS